jgi:hypothetical protein
MPDDHQEPKEYFINRLSEQLGEMEEEVNDLDVRLDESEWDPKMDYEKQVDELKIAVQEARERLSELTAAGRQGWPTKYKETEASLGDLMSRIQTVRSIIDRILLE